MALKTFVKVSTVNNLSDARYCAGMEVDLIGFNLEKDQPSYISPENYKELTEWLSGVEYVGEFETYNATNIAETLKLYTISAIQIANPSEIPALTALGLPIILKTSRENISQTPQGLNISYLLITGDDNALSEEDIEAVKTLAGSYNILLGTGINEKNVESVLEQTGAKGIALQGGDELRPGYKDYDELADILEALEIEV